jgi:hypothetical protein
MSINYAAIPPLISHRAPDSPYWAAAGSGGGGGGGSSVSSFQQVFTSSFVTSTITCAGQSQFNKPMTASDTINAQLGIWTSSISGTAAATASTLICDFTDQGLWAVNLGFTTGIANGFPMSGFVTIGNNSQTAGYSYRGFTPLYPSTGIVYTLSVSGPVNQDGPAELYIDNSGPLNVPFTGAITKLGL